MRGSGLARSYVFISAPSTWPQHLHMELWSWGSSLAGSWPVCKARSEPVSGKRVRENKVWYLFTEHKVSYNDNNLCISSYFHLRISESLWNSQPTGSGFIICSQTRALRGWLFYGLIAGWFKVFGTTYPLHSSVLFSPWPQPYQHHRQTDKAIITAQRVLLLVPLKPFRHMPNFKPAYRETTLGISGGCLIMKCLLQVTQGWGFLSLCWRKANHKDIWGTQQLWGLGIFFFPHFTAFAPHTCFHLWKTDELCWNFYLPTHL